MDSMLRRLFFLILFILTTLIDTFSLYADVSDENNLRTSGTLQSAKISENKKDSGTLKADEKEPPRIGNFSLPTSQQPSGLFAFGGNVIDRGEVQFFTFMDEFIGKNRIAIDLIPSILFGVTDELSILFNFPSTIMKNDCDRSSGLEDFYVQIEYAFYNKKTTSYIDQATILANVTVPTGSVHKNPPTGYGSPSFFLGTTYYHMLVDWFVFLGEGAILTTSERGTKIGNQFLYQFGFGRNIPSPKGWIYAWMCEIDGQYYQKNRVKGKIDPNSGGNVVFATPSLWISSEEILLQFGVSLPVSQNWFGRQHKFDYALNFNFGWSFY